MRPRHHAPADRRRRHRGLCRVQPQDALGRSTSRFRSTCSTPSVTPPWCLPSLASPASAAPPTWSLMPQACLPAQSRPMIVAGGGARRCRSRAARGRRAAVRAGRHHDQRQGRPIDEHHPLALGARMGTASVVAAADAADVLLVVGAELGNSDMWQGMLAPRGHVVRIDVDASMADVNISADTMLVGDAAIVLGQLDAALEPRRPSTMAFPSGSPTSARRPPPRQARPARAGGRGSTRSTSGVRRTR